LPSSNLQLMLWNFQIQYSYLLNRAIVIMSMNHFQQIFICTQYSIMWSSLSVTCNRLVVFSRYSGFLHQYNWNIVESVVKHHNPTLHVFHLLYWIQANHLSSWQLIFFPK
jgi:hypothetical protein